MELSILQDIVIIFALSTFVNLIFTKLKVPTIVGYLLTGVIAGPHLLSLISNLHNIELIADLGVVLLLFSIGMEFSLKHLLRIRRIVFFGGFLQVTVTALFFLLIFSIDGISWKTGLFIGFIAALSSSALVLKILQERSELTSNYGRTILGILIFQDLMLVPLLLFIDFFSEASVNFSGQIVGLLLKTLLIIGFVYVGNRWLVPKLLRVVAFAKSQELFIMCIFLICLAFALLTSELGMSLAFGAFLAGLMISESEYSHNAFGSLIPFKDLFSSFFFVSIGMMLDLSFVVHNFHIVLLAVVLLILVKSVVAGGTGFLLGHTFKGTVMVGLALSQVGEFSFILAKIGLDKSIITSFYYQLFLAVAVISMAVSPFVMQLSLPIAKLLLKLHLPSVIVDGLFPLPEIEIPSLQKHLVIIGKDSSSLSLSAMAKHFEMPYVSIIFDPVIAKERQKDGETVIYGDAVNESILRKAQVDNADIVVISVGSIIPSMTIIEKVRSINKHVYIIVRAKDINDIEQLFGLGADQIFPENFEIAIDVFGRILSKRLIPKKDINQSLAEIRDHYYGIFREKDNKIKSSLLDELPNIEISAIEIDDNSEVIGKSVSDIQLRKIVGVTLVAIKRGNDILEHPSAKVTFQKGDVIYVLGKYEQNANAVDFFSSSINVGNETYIENAD
jgi:monovalent cation:H+ antiporter-2, CPA2 family